MTDSCNTCRFFKPETLSHQYMGVPVSEPIKGGGFCRRETPKADARGIGRFPIVMGDDWCGKHEPRAA